MNQQSELNEFDHSNLQRYHQKVYHKADAITKTAILIFFLTGVGLSFIYDTYLLAFAMGGATLAAYFLMQMFLPASQLLRYVASFLFWNFGLQFVFQMQGLIEVHLVFFIALAILLFYEDWTILLPATLYTITTLVLFYVYKNGDSVKAYLPLIHNTSQMVFFAYGIMIVIYSALCMQWSVMQRAQTKESALQALKLDEQLRMMDFNINFSESISRGDLNVEYPASQRDTLGQSLLNMRNSLMEATTREAREKFLTTGLARIGEIMRQYSGSLDLLCEHVIMDIVKYMKANQGAIFMTKEAATPNEHYQLMACRAWERKKYLEKIIKMGEGLVGQAVIERQTIFLTKVPNNYATISSGLGEANPNCVLIVPLKFEQEIVGIIELASFKVFQPHEIDFLEKVGNSIASTMITTQNYQKNRELLEQARTLTEQLKEQEENIRQNMEAMQASQEEMMRKEKEINKLMSDSLRNEKLLREIEAENRLKKHEAETLAFMDKYQKTLLNVLDQLPHKIFLKDHEGKMLLVNTVVAKAHSMSVEELIGKSDFDFVDAKTAQEWRNQELEIIKKGSETYIFEEHLNGEAKTLRSTKMAFYIEHLDKVGLLGIQTDITEMQRLKEQVEGTVLV